MAALFVEAMGFWNEYSNLVGVCTASSGVNCEVGDPVFPVTRPAFAAWNWHYATTCPARPDSACR